MTQPARQIFARLADAADAVGVELDVVERIVFEQFAKAEDGELVLAAGDGDAAIALQLLVAARVVGDHRLFEPAEIEGLEQRQHALGVVEGPAHVGIGHQVDARRRSPRARCGRVRRSSCMPSRPSIGPQPKRSFIAL